MRARRGDRYVTNEYGDDHDTMGGVTGHVNAYQNERLGWLNDGQIRCKYWSAPMPAVNWTTFLAASSISFRMSRARHERPRAGPIRG